MNDETGTGGVEATMAAYGYGTWETRRMPDAIRAAALANAVDLCGQANIVTIEEVLNIAREFEAYLTVEDAHD